eukprot:COSAG01_NODE_41204_length_454_cov_1.259155_1_plen_24_part_01
MAAGPMGWLELRPLVTKAGGDNNV